MSQTGYKEDALMRWLAILALAGRLAAQDIKQIDVPGHAGQSYALFVPSNYAAGRRWPTPPPRR